jgi:hypothetical protein
MGWMILIIGGGILSLWCVFIAAREVFLVLSDPHDIWEDEDET